MDIDAGDMQREAPIRRQTLHEQAANRVRDMIIEGRLAPGDRVNEVHLGAELGISRTPLREAIRTLASEGLIDLVAGRGAVVRRLTPKAVHDMLEVLAHIEPLAARLACIRASDADIAAIRSMHDEMMRWFATRQRLPYYKLNQNIHTGIVALAGNETLAEIHGGIQSRLKRIRFLGNSSPGGWEAAAAEHEIIMDALERRDAETAAGALADHLWRTWDRVKDGL